MPLGINTLRNFFMALSATELEGPSEELALKLNLPLSEGLKGHMITKAPDDWIHGRLLSSLYTFKLIPWWVPSFMLRTKCYVACATLPAVGFHCITICVSCLDKWPGPGCVIHIYN